MRRDRRDKPSESEIRAMQMERMLLWFETQLPEHELEGWEFEIHPNAIRIVNERTNWAGSPFGEGTIHGSGRCHRCGAIFDTGIWPQSHYYDPAKHDFNDYPTLAPEAQIESAKAQLQRDAESSGKCWGDVPKVDDRPCFVVAD